MLAYRNIEDTTDAACLYFMEGTNGDKQADTPLMLVIV